MLITAELLKEIKACGTDTAKFKERWPLGAETTLENCIEAFCVMGLSPSWAANALFRYNDRCTYDQMDLKIWEKYQRINNQASRKCDAAEDAAWEEWNKRQDTDRDYETARKVRIAQTEKAHAKYDKIRNAARDASRKELATAFYQAMKAKEERDAGR